ncbi:MAG: sigma-70 family RNA polymerase sigma factor [Clostridia bacterium]|nr:sigma-70 family RNA polymerase sigma factor [Clostridia bacterium]
MIPIPQYHAFSDAELVRFTREGDTNAYGELVARYKTLAFTAALRILREHHAAEDMAQDSFIYGWQRLESLHDPERFGGWLLAIVRRRSINYLNRRHIHVDIDELEGLELFSTESTETTALQRMSDRRVNEAVSGLPETHRPAVVMYYFQNKSVREIAAALGIPEGTCKSRLHDARAKLKGVLADMDMNRNISGEFEEKVMKEVRSLQSYWWNHDKSYEGFQQAYDRTVEMIGKMDESERKWSALADAYLSLYWRGEKTQETKDKIVDAARKGKNAKVLCDFYIEELIHLNDAKIIRDRLDKEALLDMNALGAKSERGKLLFWRGRQNFTLHDMDAALADFGEAVRLIDADNIYHANAVAAVRGLTLARDNCADPYSDIGITGEGLTFENGKLLFNTQPGFTSNSSLWKKHRYDSIFYYSSACDRTFFDMNQSVGTVVTSKGGDSTLEYVADDETVVVPVGTFQNCLHTRYRETDYAADVWYGRNAGLVKVVFTHYGEAEVYELVEYKADGEGYMPFVVGNRWIYRNPALNCDTIYQYIEREITYTDGRSAHFTGIAICNYAKDSSGSQQDSESLLMLADRDCDSWKVDEAMVNLKKAAALNTTEISAFSALSALEYLEHFKAAKDKNYRFCPSSANGSLLYVTEEGVQYSESEFFSMGPYRFGTRHEENRIFGMKPFRHLTALTGYLWKPEWKAGYETQLVPQNGYNDTRVSMRVDDGGTIETAAGVFENCLKLTFDVEVEGQDKNYYYRNGFRYMWCGHKEFWFAPGVGIVRMDCDWGGTLSSRLELTAYRSLSTGGEYLPVIIGNRWEYDEINLTAEGYRAKRMMEVRCGRNGRYLLSDLQEAWYLGTEEEYETMKQNLKK